MAQAVAIPEGGEDASRMPRWNIMPETLYVLEDVFRTQPFPPMMMREKLAKTLDVTPRQVQIWFQNRRQRARHTKFKPGAGGMDDGNSIIYSGSLPIPGGASQWQMSNGQVHSGPYSGMGGMGGMGGMFPQSSGPFQYVPAAGSMQMSGDYAQHIQQVQQMQAQMKMQQQQAQMMGMLYPQVGMMQAQSAAQPLMYAQPQTQPLMYSQPRQPEQLALGTIITPGASQYPSCLPPSALNEHAAPMPTSQQYPSHLNSPSLNERNMPMLATPYPSTPLSPFLQPTPLERSISGVDAGMATVAQQPLLASPAFGHHPAWQQQQQQQQQHRGVLPGMLQSMQCMGLGLPPECSCSPNVTDRFGPGAYYVNSSMSHLAGLQQQQQQQPPLPCAGYAMSNSRSGDFTMSNGMPSAQPLCLGYACPGGGSLALPSRLSMTSRMPSGGSGAETPIFAVPRSYAFPQQQLAQQQLAQQQQVQQQQPLQPRAAMGSPMGLQAPLGYFAAPAAPYGGAQQQPQQPQLQHMQLPVQPQSADEKLPRAHRESQSCEERSMSHSQSEERDEDQWAAASLLRVQHSQTLSASGGSPLSLSPQEPQPQLRAGAGAQTLSAVAESLSRYTAAEALAHVSSRAPSADGFDTAPPSMSPKIAPLISPEPEPPYLHGSAAATMAD